MSSSQAGNRVDPLVDAYRQASELEAQTARALPGAAVRAAVLAHARVVAQSVATAEPALAVTEAVRAMPAANESRPIWRIAAGVLLGVAGMWMYQLTRPVATGEANVAVMPAPQSPKSSATESATPAAAAPAIPAAAPAAAVAAPTKAEAAVAVATRAKIAPAANESSSRERVNSTSNSAGASGPRDAVADKALRDTSVALAKVDAPAKRSELSAPATAQIAVAASPVAPVARAAAAATPPATTSAIPEVATSEPFPETAVASAEMRKANRASAASRPAAAAAPSAAAPPNAFPAATSGTIAAAPPPAAAPVRQMANPQLGGSTAMTPSVATIPDATMFSAVRIGDVSALRAALARGANVNARDETGRTPLQIARERNDLTVVKALELAGAK